MNIYVATSWSNGRQPEVVDALRNVGHDVYDFRHPEPGNNGFHWSEIDPAWQGWGPGEMRAALEHPIALDGYAQDMAALMDADATVLVMPCGRSAHLELGWAVGRGQRTYILLSDGEPELMYRMASHVCVDLYDLMDAIGSPRAAGS